MTSPEDLERAGLLATQAAAKDPHERYTIDGLSFEEAMTVLDGLARRGLVAIDKPNRGDGRLMSAREISLTAAGRARLAEYVAADSDDGVSVPQDPTVAWQHLRAKAEPFSAMDRAINEAVGDLTSRGMFRSGPSIRWAMEIAYDFGLHWNADSGTFERRRVASTTPPPAPSEDRAGGRGDAPPGPNDAEQRALNAAWAGTVPPSASAIHARWWQLEAWLRSLVYVELRARFGASWTAKLPKTADERRAKDARAQTYMSTPDATAHLAYLDVGDLFKLIDDHWELFAPTLLDRDIWQGRVIELNKIRRRIAHCRRPHGDDLARLEQTLRDIDHGAFRAMAHYNEQAVPAHDMPDALVQSWVQGQHRGAHIIEHADRQYDTRFRLTYSARPWAKPLEDGQPVSGTQGYLWHATWFGAHVRDLGEWWRDTYLDIDNWRDLIVYVCADMFEISVSFAACDDPNLIGNAIEHAFQATLQRNNLTGLSIGELEELDQSWSAQASNLDLRVQVRTGWNFLTTDLHPVTIFNA